MLASIMVALMEGAKAFGIVDKSKFTWKIPNFSQLSEKRMYSEIFIVDDCKWRLLIYPKGFNRDDHLSIFLEVADSKDLPDGWNRDVKFSLSVVNHKDKSATEIKEAEQVLSAKEINWGFPSFIPLSKLKDPAKGYLVKDTVTVEAKVHVLGAVHSSKDSKKDVQTTSKLLLAELSSMTDKQNHFTLDSMQAPETDKFQQQKEALRMFFSIPFEAIQQADCFAKIEECLKALVKSTTNLKEKTALEDIISRLANVKTTVHNAKETAETAKARRASLADKTADLNSKLEERQKELSSLEFEFSRISDEEAKLAVQKKSVSVKLERANEETSKEIEEKRSLEAETKKVNEEWVGAKEKTAAAKGHWDLLREDLGLAKLH